MPNLIYFQWDSNEDGIIIPALEELGFTVICMRYELKSYTKDLDMAQAFITKIHETKAECVFSMNYFPIISLVCDVTGLPYYSWVFDSPHYTLYAKTVSLPCNHIGVFDRSLAEKLHSLGKDRVTHLPLAADQAAFRRSIEKNEKDYRCDVSFVGSLYTGTASYSYYEIFRNEILNSDDTNEIEVWKLLDTLTERQAFTYDRDYLSQTLSSDPALTEYLYSLMEQHNLTLDEDFDLDHQSLCYDGVLAKEVTAKERLKLLSEVAALCRDEAHHFRLFTASDLPADSILNAYTPGNGYVNYIHEMPKVFAQSRINLNITLRTIRTGIPLRAIDVLSCGGFLLTNPQEELYDYLKEGEDFEVFRSVGECLDKIRYYLANEDKRAQIAWNGLKKAEKYFSIKDTLKCLIN